MTTAIYKYVLEVFDTQEIEMPAGAKILTVQYQESIRYACLWAIVDPNSQRTEKRKIVVVGTGYQSDKNLFHLDYIGTFQHHGLVFHVFEDSGFDARDWHV